MKRPDLSRLDGTVRGIRYASEAFTVASFAPQSGGEVVIVGDLAGIEEGQRLSLYGRSSTHARHGPQFRVDYFHTLMEESREGIQRFLEEEVEGIGPAYARRIVGYFYPLFGTALLDELQRTPDRLKEISGLGETRILALVKALEENFGNRQLLMQLYEYGLGPTMARTIVKSYEERGVDAARIFRETPYQLVQDVPGLGFETVDRIALQRGIPSDDAGRIQAGISDVLLRAFQQEGHHFLPFAPLVRQLERRLWDNAPPPNHIEAIGDALELLQNQRYVQIVTVGEELVGYARYPWLVEAGLTEQLQRLLRAPVPPLSHFERDPDAVRRDAEARSSLTLDAPQRLAFDHAMTRGVCVITGGPGTGKSTLARLIVDTWEVAGLTVKLAAPTGRAARRLTETTGRPATTVHRLLEWREGAFQRNDSDPLEGEAFLIDESSMLDAPLAWALCRAIPAGARLLFMGDVDQLPSVGPGNVLRDLIASDQVPVARLSIIHRQDISQENLIVTLAHAVNQAPAGAPIPGGPPLARRPEEGNVFLFDSRLPWARCTCGGVRLPQQCPACRAGSVLAPLPEPSRGAELIQHLVTERIPSTFGVASADIQVIAPLYRGPLGVDELNERLRAVLNPARTTRPELRFGNRHFRLGDRVMAIRNRYEKDVVNGLQGILTDVDPATMSVTALFDGEVKTAFKGEELDDLTHAYAITAHKSQGGEFPVVLLALDQSAGRLLYRQLLYTAITRARHLLVLVGDPVALERATANDRPRHRWTGLAWWLAGGSPEPAGEDEEYLDE